MQAMTHADWQQRAIMAYHQGHAADRLTRDLIDRLRSLTGQVVAPDAIYVAWDGDPATAVLDGSIFRLCQRDLVVVRSCTVCGIGQFESQPITNLLELGYALGIWQPFHASCEPADPPGWLDDDRESVGDSGCP
jgi:hypothetical protein